MIIYVICHKLLPFSCCSRTVIPKYQLFKLSILKKKLQNGPTRYQILKITLLTTIKCGECSRQARKRICHFYLSPNDFLNFENKMPYLTLKWAPCGSLRKDLLGNISQ
jgi:hypothetical protein